VDVGMGVIDEEMTVKTILHRRTDLSNVYASWAK
jgi:hypothetical protein